MFITFEGIDGCGKSTQISRFEKTLKEKGIPSVVTREPGGTKIGQTIRKILLDLDNAHMAPLAELFLYAADRAQHVSEVINPALEAGKWVISDRYFDATTVYQGVVLGRHEKLIEQLNREATLGCKPDITFLLDCPAEVALQRRAKRGKKGDRFERKTLDLMMEITLKRLQSDYVDVFLLLGIRDKSCLLNEDLLAFLEKLKKGPVNTEVIKD